MATLRGLFGNIGQSNAGDAWNAIQPEILATQNNLSAVFDKAHAEHLRNQAISALASGSAVGVIANPPARASNNFAVEIRSVANGYIVRRVYPDYHGRATKDDETYVFKDLSELPGIVAVMQSKDDMTKD